jgi:hypothetical protein
VLLAGVLSLFAGGVRAADEFEIGASSFLGASGFDDNVVGARIQADGTIVLAANLGPGIKLQGASVAAGKNGCLVRLSPDGKKLLGIAGVAKELKDMAIDEKDNLYLAAGGDGFLKLSPKGDKALGQKSFKDCVRVDAAKDGHFAVIADGSIHIFDPEGKELGTAKGSNFTNDVCVEAATKTVVFCGFRNAHAFDGKKNQPVQIPYIFGLAYDGTRKWEDYNWSTDQNSDRFINKPTNNMADSRADRCSIGRDGKLYVTFQVAGGNHIFRYSPTNIMEKAELAGGDKYHQFYNSRAEHKNFFARYEPATGKYLAGQQFCGRLSNGRANYVATKTGEINADEEGRVYVVGVAAAGLPLSQNPGGGEYTGGGFILVMSPDLKTRLLCTRTAGAGAPHAVDARAIGGKLRAVFAGGEMPKEMFVQDALQPEAADEGKEKKDPKDGFFVVLGAK